MRDFFFVAVYFLSCDGGAIFTSESGALLAYLQMQIGVTLYLQPAFFSVHKRRNTILRNKTRIWHPQSTCVLLCWIIYFLMLKQCCLVEQEMYKWNRVMSDMEWTSWNPVEVPISFRFDVLYTPKMCTPGHECETTPQPSSTSQCPTTWVTVRGCGNGKGWLDKGCHDYHALHYKLLWSLGSYEYKRV